MLADVWIPFATGLVGALIGLAGVVYLTRANRNADKERWQREQRIEAYTQLAAAAHRMIIDENTRREERNSQFYAAYYKVSMIAGDKVDLASQHLLKATEALLQEMHPGPGQAVVSEETVREVGRTLDVFITYVRAELGTTDEKGRTYRPQS